MVHYLVNVKKEFPNMIRVVVFHEPKQIITSDNTIKRNKVQVSDSYEPAISSLHRTKALIRDLVLANDFDLFATFTFDPDKIDRYNYGACFGKISRWIHNQHAKSPNFKYIFIPEQHKDGAWHFHALLANYEGTMHNTHHKSPSGQDIYNISSYRGGFTTACYITDKDKVASYVMKYITKDFIRKFNQRRFTCSRNLSRPVVTKNVLLDLHKPHKTIFSNDSYDLLEFPLSEGA